MLHVWLFWEEEGEPAAVGSSGEVFSSKGLAFFSEQR